MFVCDILETKLPRKNQCTTNIVRPACTSGSNAEGYERTAGPCERERAADTERRQRGREQRHKKKKREVPWPRIELGSPRPQRGILPLYYQGAYCHSLAIPHPNCCSVLVQVAAHVVPPVSLLLSVCRSACFAETESAWWWLCASP